MKKKLISILFFGIILTFFSGRVYAKEAFIATDKNDFFPDIASQANNYLVDMGYSIDFYKNPSQYVIRDRLNKHVTFYTGHGNFQLVETGESGVYYTNDYTHNISGKTYVGIGTKNLANSYLQVFAGCQTSNNSYGNDWPIARRASNSYGAKSSVGWTTDVAVGSLETYIANFMAGLRAQKGIQEAIDYANGFAYKDNRVKNSYAWGDTSTRIYGWMSPSSINSILKNTTINDNTEKQPIEYNISANKYYSLKEESENTLAENYISNQINEKFNISDYIIEENNANNKYISYIYAPDGVKTNNVYTVYINNDGIYKLTDYTYDNFDVSRETIVNFNKLSEEQEEEFINKNLDKNIPFEIREKGYYFDSENNKHYFYLIVDYAYSNGTFDSQEYFMEL